MNWNITTRTALDDAKEARDHLGAALVQVLPSDDQIIIGHMRDAHALLQRVIKAVEAQ